MYKTHTPPGLYETYIPPEHLASPSDYHVAGFSLSGLVADFVQGVLGLGHNHCTGGVAGYVEGSDQHLDGPVNGEDEAVRHQGNFVTEADAGEDGEEDWAHSL